MCSGRCSWSSATRLHQAAAGRWKSWRAGCWSPSIPIPFSVSLHWQVWKGGDRNNSEEDRGGSSAREETLCFFILARGSFYSKHNWLYLVRRLSLTLLDDKNSTGFNRLFLSLPCGHVEERAVQLKWDSKGQLPPPFPFQKTFQSCVFLKCCIGRKHTMQLSALCWCVAH